MNDEKVKHRRKKLGRGLADVSHVFLSGVSEKQTTEPGDFWLPERSLITVTSPSEIKGKTLLAANLAYGLASRGRRVKLVSDDETLISQRADRLSSDAGGALGILSLREMGLTSSRVDVDPDWVDGIASDSDLVIVEIAASDPKSAGIWRFSRLVIVIAEPGTQQMQSAYATIKQVTGSSCKIRIGLVVNLARSYDEAERCFRKISGACRQFLKINIRNYGHILFDESVEETKRQGRPLWEVSDSSIGDCMRSIVRCFVIDERAIGRRRKEVKQRSCV